MKKMKRFAYVGAIALLSVLGFSACSSGDDAVAETNPNYNPETNEVLAQFVFNVSTGNTMRMTSAATQASSSEHFRGIDNAVLFSAKQASDGKHLAIAGTMNKRYDLSRVIAAGNITESNSRRVIETSLPLNTNTLLFYGKAIQSGVSDQDTQQGYTYKDAYGYLENYSVAGGAGSVELANTVFELSPRINGNVEKFEKIETLLAGVLTVIINTNLSGDNHVALSGEKYGFDVAIGDYPADLTWASYNNVLASDHNKVDNSKESPVEAGHELYPLEKKLADAYRELTVIKQAEGELRAGYGVAILQTIQDLWSVVNEVRCAIPLNKAEAVAKYMAERIHERINQYFNGTVPNDGKQVTDVSFLSTASIITHFASDTAWPTSAGTKPSDFSSINDVLLANFPQKMFHVASGSTHYTFNAEKNAFEYVKNYNTSAIGNPTGFTVESYYYPPELLYFGNSPVRVSNNEHKVDSYPATVSDWQNNDKWDADWTQNSHVISSTQSVAMQNNINYGTSLLKTTISYGSTALKDNNHAIQKAKDESIGDADEPDKVINVDETSFKLVGLVIGGQWKKAGWNYLPLGSGNEQGYIYDCYINDAADIPASGSSTPNYTLVFDNYNAQATDTQDKVYVALELQNNSGQDFFGAHNVIRNGGIFYLIGELDPGKAGLTMPTWPTHHPLPPYNSDGTSIEKPRVFMQDFMTTANFVIGENSLKHAYMTVPDLRYSSLSLGLSVDINWSSGINFGDVILGQ